MATTFTSSADPGSTHGHSGVVSPGSTPTSPVPGARPGSSSSAPLASGLGSNSTYSGCDIKLVVHFPSGEDAGEADEEYLRELEQEATVHEQTIRSYFPDYVVDSGTAPPTPDLSGLSANDRQRVQTALDGLRAVRRDRQEETGGSGENLTTKVLAEIQTLSVGVYRTKLPVRNLGATYVRGYARGTLSIAGSMIFTVFNRNVWTEILQTFNSTRDYGYRDQDPYNFLTVVPHQLPPMDISIVFANELGNISYMALYGVEIMNEGLVMSVNDLYQEGTYCVDADTEVLTNSGWKKYNEVFVTDNILTLNPDSKNIEWQQPSAINLFNYSGPMVSWKHHRGADYLVTPNHRWLTTDGYQHKKGKEAKVGFEETCDLIGKNRRLIIAGGDPQCFAETPKYSNELVELIGWIVTEGTRCYTSTGKVYAFTVSQSESVNPENVFRLRQLKEHFSIFGTTTEILSNRKVDPSQRDFYFGKGIAKEIDSIIPGRALTPEFLCKLTLEQAELLYEAMLKGDGSRNGKTRLFIQNKGRNLEMFQMLTSMLGKKTNQRERADNEKCMTLSIYGTELTLAAGLKAEEINYQGIVWCPTTPNGTWLARRSGATFWTGNSFVARDISLMSDETIASRSSGSSDGRVTGSQLSELDPRYSATLRDIRDNPYR